jgi:FkbM family methyltransferase
MDVRFYLRSIQTYFPFLHDARFDVQFFLRKIQRKPHDPDFRALRHFAPEGDRVYLDIGSNRGEGIMSQLITSKPGIRVIGFEPNPLIFDKLKKRFRGKDNVEVHNFGLGSENGSFEIYIPFYRKWMFDGLSSFKYEEAESWLRHRMWRFDEHKQSIRKIRCQTRTLDSFDLKPYFIKIDVQGFEMEVLKGGRQTIQTHTPILLIEAIQEEHKQYLAPMGYRFYRLDGETLHEGDGAINTFCIPEDKHAGLWRLHQPS